MWSFFKLNFFYRIGLLSEMNWIIEHQCLVSAKNGPFTRLGFSWMKTFKLDWALYFDNKRKKCWHCSWNVLRLMQQLYSPWPFGMDTIYYILIPWKALNVITSGQTKSDNISRMITIFDDFYWEIYSKWNFEMCSH